MSRFTLDGFDLDGFVAATLAEDLGEGGDITSAAVIPAEARFTGVMDTRDAIDQESAISAARSVFAAFRTAAELELEILVT